MSQRKKMRISENFDPFDRLPDDIVVSILCNLSSTAKCPSDFICTLLTCKRLNRLGLHPLVLSRAGSKTFAIPAKNWSEPAHRFLRQCVATGNVEASYTLGMIRFYCLQNRGGGASLMAKAAIRSHLPALYSLAVIQFNGSGGSKNRKDLRAGVALCARAAYLGHIDALRELGHCLQDGYGVPRNPAEGRRLLVQANARELASELRAVAPPNHHVLTWQFQNQRNLISSKTDPYPGLVVKCSLLSDFGCNIPAREVHPANRFLTEWFGLKGSGSEPGLRLCSHAGCGRPETRINEFRRCSACGVVNYCSRGCQAQDWKVRHKVECTPMPMDQWINQDAVDGQDEVDGDDPMAEVAGFVDGGGASVI